MKHSFLLLLCCSATLILFSQSDYQMKANSEEIEVNFLSSYYSQDGENAAVTGGIGTEELQDLSNLFVLNLPIDSTRAISLSLGADIYTSASTDNIDNNVSSASRRDLRSYGNLGFTKKRLANGETYGIRLGFSTEYDYNSLSFGLSYAKEFNEGNSELSWSAQAFIDKWSLYFPRELRGTASVPTTNRQSYNMQFVFSQVLSRRTQMAVSLEGIYMRGLLSTPFHRVYFAEQSGAAIEQLPDTRLKIPIGLRVNHYLADGVVLRSHYRFYKDDFGITAHTASLELPIDLSTAITIAPFYRYHTQTASDYFAPYKVHSVTDEFFTSDYDLSELSSHKIGLGIKYAPLYGLARAKLPFKNRQVLMLKYVHFRGSYYTRSTGLNAFGVSIDLGIGIK